MKPTNRCLFRWAIRLFFLSLVPLLISCGDQQTKEHSTAITVAGKTKKIPIRENPGRKKIEVCIKATVDWTKFDSVVVNVKRKRLLRPVDRNSFTFSALSTWANYSFQDSKEHTLHLTATFYKEGVAKEYNWCEQNDTNCTIEGSVKCSDSSTPIATVKSTASAGNSVTVSVDEQ